MTTWPELVRDASGVEWTWPQVAARIWAGFGPPEGVEVTVDTVPFWMQRDVRLLNYLAAQDGVGHMWKLEEGDQDYPDRDGVRIDLYRCETCPQVYAIRTGEGPPPEIILGR